LLYYDLCVLLPAGVLLLGKNGPLPECTAFRTIGLVGWIVVSLFLPLLLAYPDQKILPLILELTLLVLLIEFLNRLKPVWKSPAHA
jgi:hypothetical protein